MRAENATHVYVIETDHAVKVGITRMGPAERLRDLRRAGGFPDAQLIRSWPMTYRKARKVEAAAHWRLADTRTEGEWFHCHPFEACDAVERSIRYGGVPLEIKFTPEETANIRKYLESRRASMRQRNVVVAQEPLDKAEPAPWLASFREAPTSGATAPLSHRASPATPYHTAESRRPEAQKTTRPASRPASREASCK